MEIGSHNYVPDLQKSIWADDKPGLYQSRQQLPGARPDSQVHGHYRASGHRYFDIIEFDVWINVRS